MVGEVQKTLIRGADVRHTRYMRYLVRQSLLFIEDGIDLLHEGTADEWVTFEQNHHLLFGKVSVVDAFLKLAGLLLTLNQLPEGGEVKVAKGRSSGLPLEYSGPLLQAFARKRRLQTKLNIMNLSGHATKTLNKKEKRMLYIAMHYK